MGIRNESAYLCGLFVYRVEPDLEHGRAFVVDVIAALDTLDAKAVIHEMTESVRSMTRRLNCSIARIRVTQRQNYLATYLTSNGFASDGHSMSLPMARTGEAVG
jgi:hypothetical protein